MCCSPLRGSLYGVRGLLIEWSVVALLGIVVFCSMLVPFHSFVCHPYYVCVLWCDVVWHGIVWCDVVLYGVVRCGVVWCGVVWCGVIWYGVV